MTVPAMNDGIQAIQNGNLEEGARLLRSALQDTTIPPSARAIGLMWLAETHPDPKFKIQCYQQAATADPNNQDVTLRLQYWQQQAQQQQPPANMPGTSPQQAQQQQPPANMPGTSPQQAQQQQPPANMPGTSPQQAQQQQPPANMPGTSPQQAQQQQPPANMPGTSPQQAQQQQPPANMPEIHYRQGTHSPYQPQAMRTTPQNLPQTGQATGQQPALQQAVTVVGIEEGPNGNGSGFFVAQDGLVVTTRFVAGGLEQIAVNVPGQGRITAQVVRSFPLYDVALLATNIRVPSLVPQVQTNRVNENEPLVALAYPDQRLDFSQRATRQQMPDFWIPTNLEDLQDAGGNPMFDSSSSLAGMLTQNASRTTYHVYGLHISMINHLINQYRQEAQSAAQSRVAYCPSCGIISHAPSVTAYYCEHCGATLPPATEISRHPQAHTAAFYHENEHRPCVNCQSTVGVYQGACLRCGTEQAAV